MTKVALNPSHPERVCWGCDQYCRADDLACGNGTERTQHPIELFGSDWVEWAREQGGYDCSDPSADRREQDCATEVIATAGSAETDELRERALRALRNVIDPELGVNVVDLGLVYRLEVEATGRIGVELSMTTPACPLGDHIMHEVEERLRALPGVRDANVQLVWSPPWDPSRMSAQVRALLGWSS